MCDHRYRVVAFALMAAIAGSSVGDPFDAELSAVEEAIAEHEQQLPTNNAELVRTRRDIAELAKQKLEQQVARDSAALEQIERTLVGQARSLAGSSIAAPSPLPATGQVEQNGLPSAISGAPNTETTDQPTLPQEPFALIPPSTPPAGDAPALDLAALADEGFFSVDGLSAPLDSKINGLKRRVLSRPNAMLVKPDGKELQLDTFSILYVFSEKDEMTGQRWLAVGSRGDKPDGWVRYDATEDWMTMLVMEYAPLTSTRRPVLFFSSKDALENVIQDTSGYKEAEAIYAEVEQLRDAGGRVLTVEPTRSVTGYKPYLLPILDHTTSNFNYGNYGDVNLLQLAGLTGKTSSRESGPTSIGEQGARKKDIDPATFNDFEIRVAFVIDTTRSMAPYLEATKDFVRSIYQRLEQRGLLERFRFALVGFRDNPDAAPGVEYLTRIFTTFDTPSDINQLFADVDALLPSAVPTADWREDVFAGLRTAINELEWRRGDARLLLLITDASARSETDPKASQPNFGAASARQMIDQHGISIHAMHIHSDEARRSAGDGEINRAQSQYQSLGRYWGIDGSNHRVFGLATERFKDNFMRALIDAARGREVEAPPINEFDEYSVIMDFQSGMKILTEENIGILDKPIASDLFRFQQEYLGLREGVEPPKFYRAWASDHDLVTPTEVAMNVSVLVTRAQLELFADTLEKTISDVDDKRSNLTEFHIEARTESGRASTDPRLTGNVTAFLEALPYKSKLLQITSSDFRSYGQGQEDLLNEVRAKLRGYREILGSNKRWMRVSQTSEEELYPLPLRDLP